jgi:hypothetical protein
MPSESGIIARSSSEGLDDPDLVGDAGDSVEVGDVVERLG